MVSTSYGTFCMDVIKKQIIDFSKIDIFEVRSDLKDPIELEFEYDLHIENQILSAVRIYEANVSHIDLDVLCVNYCGYNKIKEYKVNPDTFSQMCMQLAYYQLHLK